MHLTEQLYTWDASTTTTTLQSGGGVHDSSATVIVNSRALDRGTTTVTLALLDGNTNGGIWIVTGAATSSFSITTPQPYGTLPQSSSNAGGVKPYTVTGTGPGFEGVIGFMYLYNPSYTDIASSLVNGNSSFSTPLIYSTTYKGDALLGVYARGEANGGITAGLLVKVTIG